MAVELCKLCRLRKHSSSVAESECTIGCPINDAPSFNDTSNPFIICRPQPLLQPPYLPRIKVVNC
jgi:hypothetical protein